MILEKFKVTNKVAIITGGTRGIGLAIASALGEAGAKLVVTSRTDKFGGLDSLKNSGYDVSFFESDMHDKSVPQKIIDFTLEKHGRVDILVNNAGVAKHGEMEEYTDELLDNIMNINVDSVFRMCRSAITPMKKQGGGVILNIGSISGLVSNIPQPQVAYNASKAAVHMMTKSLASDFAKDNIHNFSSTNLNIIHADIFKWKYALTNKKMNQERYIKYSDSIYLIGDWITGPRIENAFLSGYSLAMNLNR